ncbi:MAG: hypothetical protein JXQ66_07340, partial [Campylobacterales bacterium]|nr:hypothetical protein [Campylobacterales bacterium]
LVAKVKVNWREHDIYHIAQTNPVDLDASSSDSLYFVPKTYTQGFLNKEIAIKQTPTDIKVESNKFTFDKWSDDTDKSTVYKTVLVFTKAQDGKQAVGNFDTEDIVVKVVESKHWSNEIKDENITIGDEIKSSFHDSDINHTGCIVKAPELVNSMYNVDTYNPQTLQGAIFAVNKEQGGEKAAKDGKNDLVVAWYKNSYADLSGMEWPSEAVRYTPDWDRNLTDRIVIASRLGSDGLDKNHTKQLRFDPSSYSDLKIYNQPDRDKPGFNPNEEHAIVAPSFRYIQDIPRPNAVFALRNDLNQLNDDSSYTSEPFVLATYKEGNSYKMKVYEVQWQDIYTSDEHPSYAMDKNGDGEVDLEEAKGEFKYVFDYPIYAGDKVTAPYPLDTIIGANLIKEIEGKNSGSDVNAYWEDKTGNPWAIAGSGKFKTYFWYPLQKDFWYPSSKIQVGDIIPWSHSSLDKDNIKFSKYESLYFISDGVNYQKFKDEVPVKYSSYWKADVPTIRLGETVTFSGGEELKDNPKAKGLPAVVAWASGEIVYDGLNKKANIGIMGQGGDYTAKLFPSLREIKVDLESTKFPTDMEPATKRTKNVAGKWFFEELHAGLKQRIYYDQGLGKLVLRGILNEKFAGDPKLIESPGGYDYILQANVLTIDDLITLRKLEGINSDLQKAFNRLYALSINPNLTNDELNKVEFSETTKIVKTEFTDISISSKVLDISKTKYSVDGNCIATGVVGYGLATVFAPFTFGATYLLANDMVKSCIDRETQKIIETFKSNYPAIAVTIDIDNDKFKTFAEKYKTDLVEGDTKRFNYDEVAKKLTITPKYSIDKDNLKYKVSADYFKDDTQKSEFFALNKENIKLNRMVAKAFALMNNKDFYDLEIIEIVGSNVQYKVKKDNGKTMQTVENSVGLSQFLRDANNRFMVLKSLDEIEKNLPNGVLPAGIEKADISK